MDAPFELPAELTVHTGAGLRAQLLERLHACGSGTERFALDAAGVVEVDAAGLQLLLALAASLRRRGVPLQVVAASGPFRRACAQLGLHEVPGACG